MHEDVYLDIQIHRNDIQNFPITILVHMYEQLYAHILIHTLHTHAADRMLKEAGQLELADTTRYVVVMPQFTYVCMHACMHAGMYACVNKCMYVCMYIFMHEWKNIRPD